MERINEGFNMKKFKINHQIILGSSITLLSDKNSLKKILTSDTE